jgi:hypothetical protein
MLKIELGTIVLANETTTQKFQQETECKRTIDQCLPNMYQNPIKIRSTKRTGRKRP